MEDTQHLRLATWAHSLIEEANNRYADASLRKLAAGSYPGQTDAMAQAELDAEKASEDRYVLRREIREFYILLWRITFEDNPVALADPHIAEAFATLFKRMDGLEDRLKRIEGEH